MRFKSMERNSWLMNEGDYECICTNVTEGVSPNSGTEYISFEFVVRDDVDQSYKGKIIDKRFWKGRDGLWPESKIGEMANALGIPREQDFETFDLINLCGIIHVSQYTDNQGIKRNGFFVRPSMLTAPKQQNVLEGMEVDDDDLPFA